MEIMDEAHDGPSAMPMTAESAKRIRKGTRSCTECRQRKIRCKWDAPSDRVCVSCHTRGRECQPQLYRRSTTAPKMSSRDRIQRLEQQLASITASVRDKEPSYPIAASPEDAGDDADSSADERDSFDGNEGPGTSPPAHLRFLFDSAIVGPRRREEDNLSDLSQARCSKRYLDQARSRLQRLIPPRVYGRVSQFKSTERLRSQFRGNVRAVANYADSWMTVYLSLFPSTSPISSREDLIVQYDVMSTPEAHPVSIAMFLLTFAITALQVPQSSDVPSLEGWGSTVEFAKEVVHAVQQSIISHTGLAITVDGIEVMVMFMRLQLSLGDIRSQWLTLRRAIAFAELIGLPRAWYNSKSYEQRPVLSPSSVSSSSVNRRIQKTALWEAICATDRMTGMMFNLPSGTVSHRFPAREVMTPDGIVSARAFLFEASSIALKVHELDEDHITGLPYAEIYEKVLLADKALRSLKATTPKEWWNEYMPFSPDSLVQFWHCYLTARIHLHAAMSDDEEYAYSRIRCTEACESMCRRYGLIRKMMNSGFFVVRIIDMQVFTAGTFLLLTSMRANQAPDATRMAMILVVVESLEHAAEQYGADFAREGAATMRSLISLVKDGRSVPGSQVLTLSIPLLGKVRIGRKGAQDIRPEENFPSQQMHHSMPPNAGLTPNNAPIPISTEAVYAPALDPAMANYTLPWLMELDINSSTLQDPFLTDDFTGFEQWMDMNGTMSNMAG